MLNLEKHWRSVADEAVLQAAGELETYSSEAKSLILAEVRRRGLQLPVPHPPIAVGDSGIPDEPRRIAALQKELIVKSVVAVLLLAYVLTFISSLKAYGHEARGDLGCIFLPFSILHGLSALIAFLGAAYFGWDLVRILGRRRSRTRSGSSD